MSAMPDIAKGKAAAILGLIAAVLVVGLVFVTPVVAAFSAQNDEREDALRQLGQYQAEIASRPALEAELKSLNLRGASVPGVIEGESTALSQAQLQSQMKALLDANKGEVRSIQVLPVALQGGFEIIAVECDLTVPANRLKDLVYAVGAHQPYLFIDQATITAPEPDNRSDGVPMLEMRWTIHGFRWTRPR